MSQTPSSSSAVLESARDSGSWSRQASYSAWRVRSWSTASAHRFGRGRRSFGRTTVRTGSPAARRSRYRRWRAALVMPTRLTAASGQSSADLVVLETVRDDAPVGGRRAVGLAGVFRQTTDPSPRRQRPRREAAHGVHAPPEDVLAKRPNW